MDAQKVQQYLDRIPVEIREAVMELDTPGKWAIFIALAVDGDKYFNQLKKEFMANPNTLDKALKSLVMSGLVEKKVKQLADIGDTNRTYYTTTRLGEKLLNNLQEVVLPPLAAPTAPVSATRIVSRREKGLPTAAIGN
ncbi:MAG: winged helix-turn-helix transcriptional regulator [Methanoregula sp.]|nr:winged helix-turn-helix transcriptional regulator [Methanoregula sp.]